MKTKKKEHNIVQHISFSIDENERLKKAIGIVTPQNGGYGKVTMASFCRTVIMREVDKIIKKGK